MTDDQAAALARAAGADLASLLHEPDLPRQIEVRLAMGDDADAPTRMPGLELSIVVAGFVLACAQFAYTIWKDHRDRQEKLDKDAVKQKLDLEVRSPAAVTVEMRAEVIRVVVDKLTEEAAG